MHRAEQILNAIVSRCQASVTLGIPPENVQAHRTLSLADDQGEMPFLGVNAGDDQPADEYTELDGEIGSALAVLTTAYVSGDSEQSVRSALFNARTETHKAINLDETLGLSFVLHVQYGGAAAPDIDTDAELCVGSQESRWLVIYHINPSDPS